MTFATIADRTRVALSLRQALLSVLAGDASSGAVTTMLAAEATTWALVLRGESVALPASQALEVAMVASRLSPAIRALIADMATAELQRVMTARAVLMELDRVVVELAIRVTLIKGAVPIAASHQTLLNLSDVDVLVDRGDSIRLWNALVGRGWRVVDEEAAAAEGRVLGVNHYSPLRSPFHDFSLEIHEQLCYGEDEADLAPSLVRSPIPGWQCFDRPGGSAHVVALLLHSVAKHSIRRGHVRDVLLIAGELRSLTVSEIVDVQRVIAAHALGAELLAMFRLAEAIRDGRAPREELVLRPFVANKYMSMLGYTARLAFIPNIVNLTYLAIERPPIRRLRYAWRLRDAVRPPPVGPGFDRSGLMKRLPGAAMRVVRVAHRAASVVALLGLGWVVRRHVRQVAGADTAPVPRP